MSDDVLNPGAPVAGAPDAPAAEAPPSVLSDAERAMVAQLPDFLGGTLSTEPAPAPAPAAEGTPENPSAPAADPAAPPASGDAQAAQPGQEASPTAPDPVQQFFQTQAQALESVVKAVAAIEARLNPPPAPPEAPPAKRPEEMTEEELFIHVMEQRFEAKLAEKLKPYEEERAAAAAAKAEAARTEQHNALAQSFVTAAEQQLPAILGADRVASLAKEDKDAFVDEVLADMAANAEQKDAAGRIVGRSAAQSAQVVKARLDRLVAIASGKPVPPAVPGQPARAPVVPRAPVAGAQRLPAPGGVQPVPTGSGQAAQPMPAPGLIHKFYGGSTDAVLRGLSDGWAKIPPNLWKS